MKNMILLLFFLLLLVKFGQSRIVNHTQAEAQEQAVHLSKVQAHKHQQKNHKSYTASWMKHLNDDLKASKASIPGTHDTGTFRCTKSMPCKIYQCQSWSIYEQLTNGIRYLDLRVNSQIPLTIGHKSVYFMTFEQVLIDAKRFLNQNPSQFLIFAFQRNTGDKDRSLDIFEALKINKISIVFKNHLNIPKVGDLRGKVWIYSGLGINFKENTFVMNGVMGITDAQAIYLQNYWEVFPQNITQKVKFTRQTAFGVDCIQSRMKINFLSGSVGITPFQLAQHQQGPNAKMLQGLQQIPSKCLGISVIDFPSVKLVQSIIRSNFVYSSEQM